jgi:hypothetical protein
MAEHLVSHYNDLSICVLVSTSGDNQRQTSLSRRGLQKDCQDAVNVVGEKGNCATPAAPAHITPFIFLVVAVWRYLYFARAEMDPFN